MNKFLVIVAIYLNTYYHGYFNVLVYATAGSIVFTGAFLAFNFSVLLRLKENRPKKGAFFLSFVFRLFFEN